MTTESHNPWGLLKPNISRGRLVGVATFAIFAGVTVALGLDRAVNVVVLCAIFALLILYVPSRGDVTSVITGEADERQRMIDLRASWFTLQAVVFTVLVGYFWELAHDRSGVQFLLIAVVSSLVYLASLLVLRERA
jgi:Na+/melibiose symporter-like transporter